MKKLTPFAIGTLIVFAAFLWIFSSVGEAATTQVDCSSATLQAAIDKAKPGDTLSVSGTCKENLVIYEEAARITLDGQGKATINGSDAGKPTIRVRGRGITIKGFTVTGGRHGIRVIWGGQAVIDGNTVQGAARTGIAVSRNSSARISNNTVQDNRNGIEINRVSSAVILNNTVKNNRRQGILVTQSSAASVGVLGPGTKTPSPNIIENNGRNGITVTRGSSARIAGNTIRNNKRNGINVTRVSSAHISSNMIDGNGKNGITVTRNAQVATRSGGSKISREPNSTTSNNSGVGISCASGSAVEGRLGSLNGKEGVKHIDPSCVGSLKP